MADGIVTDSRHLPHRSVTFLAGNLGNFNSDMLVSYLLKFYPPLNLTISQGIKHEMSLRGIVYISREWADERFGLLIKMIQFVLSRCLQILVR